MTSSSGIGLGHEQAEDAKDNDERRVKYVGDSEGNAEEDANYPNPRKPSLSKWPLFHAGVLSKSQLSSLYPVF